MERGKGTGPGFQSSYKQKGMDIDKRVLRAHRRSIERKNIRDEDLAKRRKIGNLSPLKEVRDVKQTDKEAVDGGDKHLFKGVEKQMKIKDKLQKWKEEKQLKKKMEMMERGKKQVFRVGVVSHPLSTTVSHSSKVEKEPVLRRSTRLSSQHDVTTKSVNTTAPKITAASARKPKQAVNKTNTRTRPISGPVSGQRVTRQSAKSLQHHNQPVTEPLKPVKARHISRSSSKENNTKTATISDEANRGNKSGKITYERGNQLSSFAPADFTFQAPSKLSAFDFKPLSPASAASFLFPGEDNKAYMGRCSTPKERGARNTVSTPAQTKDSEEGSDIIDSDETQPVLALKTETSKSCESPMKRRRSQRLKHNAEHTASSQSTDSTSSGSDVEPESKKTRLTPFEKNRMHSSEENDCDDNIQPNASDELQLETKTAFASGAEQKVQKDEKVEVMDKSAEVGASDSILSSNRSVHFKTPVEPLSVKKLRRRTVATASGCGRRTPRSASKSSRLSMSLRLLSPEESVEFLSKSPMIEMDRRTPKQKTPNPSQVNPLPTFDDLELPPQKLDFLAENDEENGNIITSENNESEKENVAEKQTMQETAAADDGHNVAYFRNLLVSETDRLNLLCDKWENTMSTTKDIPDEVEGQIRTSIGQAQLLIAQRFKQFSGLVDKCEFDIVEEGEGKTHCSDLQGFWDMIYFQVEDVNTKFDQLDKMKENSWDIEKPKIVKKKVIKKKITSNSASNTSSSKPAAKSRFAEFRAKMKQKQQDKPETPQKLTANLTTGVTPRSVERKRSTPKIAPSSPFLKIVLEKSIKRKSLGLASAHGMETLATPGGNNQSVSAISSSMKKISYATGRLSSNVMQSPLLKDNSVKQTLDSDTKTSAIVKANTGGDVVMTSIPSIDVTSSSCPQSESSDNTDHDVPYFRNLVTTETDQLNGAADEWDAVLRETPSLTEEVQGQIRSTIGQAHLLIAQRFKQFSGLIDRCEFNIIKEGEAATRCSDLQGFWDMIYYQVEDVLAKFQQLQKLKDSNWEIVKPAATKKILKKKPVTQKAVTKPSVKSKFAEFRAKMKKQQTSTATGDQSTPLSEPEKDSASNMDQIKTFDAGFFAVKSPVRSRPVSEPEKDSSSNDDQIKTFDAGFFAVKSPVRCSSVSAQRDATPIQSDKSSHLRVRTPSSPFLKAVLDRSVRKKSPGLLSPRRSRPTPSDSGKTLSLANPENATRISPLVNDITPSAATSGQVLAAGLSHKKCLTPLAEPRRRSTRHSIRSLQESDAAVPMSPTSAVTQQLQGASIFTPQSSSKARTGTPESSKRSARKSTKAVSLGESCEDNEACDMDVCGENDPMARLLLPSTITEESMDVDVNPVSPEEAEMPTKIKKDLVSDFNSARNSPRNARGRSRRSVHFTQDEKLANTAAALPCTPYNKNSLVPQERRRIIRKSECLLLFTPETEKDNARNTQVSDFLSMSSDASQSRLAVPQVVDNLISFSPDVTSEDFNKENSQKNAAAEIMRKKMPLDVFSPVRRSSRLSNVNSESLL